MSEKEVIQRVRVGRLYDMYGNLLTDKQQECLELYFLDDYSLGEIAAEQQVSRQAIHDLLKRVEVILNNYEAKLGLVERQEAEQAKLQEAILLLEQCEQGQKSCAELLQLRQILQELSNEGR